jgi:hypothetical protein
VQARGGRVVALGKFRETAAGDIAPRTVMILVEWASKAAFDGYCNDPKIASAPGEGRPRLHMAPFRQARGPAADPQVAAKRTSLEPVSSAFDPVDATRKRPAGAGLFNTLYL